MMKYIWLILVALTLFAFLIGYFDFVSAWFVFVLLVSTFIKGQLVIDYFLELKEISFKYRLIPTLWLLFVLIAIGYAYYFPA